jgi:heme exporter protein D
MGFFIGIGVVLAVLVVVGLVIDRLDRKRGVKRGMISPRGRRPRIGDAEWMGSDLSTYEPRVRGEDRPAPREENMR